MTWGLRPLHPGVAQAGSRGLPGSEWESECPDWGRLGKVLVRSEREDGRRVPPRLWGQRWPWTGLSALCPWWGWEASAASRAPPECVKLGAQPLGIGGAGSASDPFHRSTHTVDLGVGPQGTLGLKGSSGVWGVHAARGRTAQGDAWQMDGRNAGIQGNPPGRYTQGALHSVRKQPAFQESLWGGAGKIVGGCKQAQGWVPTSRVSPGGWGGAGCVRAVGAGDMGTVGDIALETL